MNFGFPLISGVMTGTALCALMLSVYSFRRRLGSSVSIPFGLFMIAIGGWAFIAACEAAAGDVNMKVLFVKFEFIGIAGFPVLWLLVAMEYNRSVRWYTRPVLLLLWLVPGVSVSLAATNELHGLFWTAIVPGHVSSHFFSNGPLLVYHHGIVFWIFVAYSYLLLIIATVLLARKALRSPDLYRYQSALLIIGVVLPWVGNVLYVAEVLPIPGLDPTPITFTLTGALVALGIFRYHFLDVVPVACDVLVRNMGDGVMVLDARGHVVDMNPAACVIFGVTLSSIIGSDFRHVVSPRLGADFRLADDRGGDTKKEVTIDNGAQLTYDVRTSSLHDDRKRLIGSLVVFHDITALKHSEEAIRGLNQTLEERVRLRTHLLEREMSEHKRAREALIKSEEKYRLLVENISDTIFSVDETGHFTYISPVIEHIAGYRPEEVVGKHFSFFVFRDDLPALMEELKLIFSGERVPPREFRAIDKKGDIHFVRTSGSLMFDEGRVTGISGTMIDITERRRIEEERHRLEVQLQHTQKLESLGVLAGGIAHDFNNILTGILGNAELAIMKIGRDSPIWENLAEIQKASFNAAELCRQMLAYSGKGKFEVVLIDLREAVREITQLLEVSISKKIAIRFDFPQEMPMIQADAAQVRQIIMNLVINASEAIGDETGAIMISTGSALCTRDDLKNTYLDDNLPEGEYAFLNVTDSGIGMDRDTQARIFEPFFTTKFTGRGLGLAAVLGIVRGHHGAIRITSDPGKGTSFRVFFPVSIVDTGGKRIMNVTAGTWKGTGTVLMVDDEESVLSVGKRMLELLDFSVLTAMNGLEAVMVFEKNIDSIVCVILDLTMPMMNGVETLKELKRIKPDIRVIITSGYSEYEISERFVGYDVAGFIQKPYHFEEFSAALKGVLAANRADRAGDSR